MSRFTEFRQSLSGEEGVLITSPVSRFFLTKFRSSDGFLFVTAQGADLFLDPRYFEMACLLQKKGVIDPSLRLRSEKFFQVFPGLLSSLGVTKVLFEDRRLTVSEFSALEKKFPQAEFLPLGKRLDLLRAVKEEEEIGKIRAAQSLAEDAFESVLPRLEAGRKETEIAADLEYFMKKNGASSPSFETICVSGSRTSLPHGTPTEEILEKNTFVTMDFGCVLDGYCSDMTRTVCVGKANEEMRRVYDTVLRAQEEALSAVRAGVLGKEVDKAARDVIEKAGFGANFGHSTGHGVGIEVHEAPSFSPLSEEKIPAGAVLSVEPGIYLPGKFGVRIEDLVAVREAGSENLNRSSKALLEL